MSSLDIYVDGSYSTNYGDRVGWGVVVEKGYGTGNFVYRRNGAITDPALIKTRQVVGELQAAIIAAELAQQLGVKVTIHYDYEGIRGFIEGAWKIKSTMSAAYYTIMKPVYDSGLVTFNKIDAHTGVPGNDEADRLAKMAIRGVIQDA